MDSVTVRNPASDALSSRRRGFTLLEMLVVIILLGVLALAALNRNTDLGQDLTTATELLKARIRFAQMRSVNNNSVHGVRSTGSSYWLFYGGDLNNREAFPGQSSNSITLPSGITMDTFTISFDYRGAPYTNAAATAGNELAANSAAASITVGGKTAAVRIVPGTGYIRD